MYVTKQNKRKTLKYHFLRYLRIDKKNLVPLGFRFLVLKVLVVNGDSKRKDF